MTSFKLSITFSECVFVAVVIQHAMCMRCIILLSVASQTIPYFSTLFKKGTIFGKKDIEHKTRLLILYTTFVTFLILRRIPRYTYISLHVKCLLFLSDLSES